MAIIAKLALQFLFFVWKHAVSGIFTAEDRIFQKYGSKDSWAVITGGSDGIGLAMAHNLAK